MTQVQQPRSKETPILMTHSICPECNQTLPTAIFEREQKVWIRKECPQHGEFEDLYFGSYETYLKFSRFAHEGRGIKNPQISKEKYACPEDCGLCGDHLTHTALANLVATNRCDLTCWYCFFYAKKGIDGGYIYEPTLDQVRDMAKTLRAQKPVPGKAIQITGGEPALREDLVDIIKILKEEHIEHVQLNTNGIKLATDPDFAREVREAGVNTVYLSFDGVTAKTNPKNHWEVPYALDNCRSVGLGIVLVPTVLRTVNDHELSAIIRYAQRNIDIIRSVNFQPVSLVGRTPREERMKFRITIPDCMKLIEEQTEGEIPTSAWFPVPSCVPITHFVEGLTKKEEYELSIHFACGAGTYVFKDGDRLTPISSFVDIEGLFEYLREKSDELKEGASKIWVGTKMMSKLGSFIDKKKQPQELRVAKLLFNALVRHDYSALGDFHKKSLFLGMMHFQDKYNQDIERVKRCDIHYLTPDKRIIPFCAFNVIPEWYRDPIQQKYGLPTGEWEKKTGKKLEDSMYRGELRRRPHHSNCGCPKAGEYSARDAEHTCTNLYQKN
ncbi:MAG: radical SAM protein [Nitrososphaerales archaeon]